MRILITGRNGQVAQALAHVNRRHELTFLARPHIDLERPQDLRDPVLRAKPDIILSCAAMTNVDACEKAESAAFAANAEAPRVLASAAAELGVPIIHVSTDYVFGGEKRTPYVESDATGPVNIYGRSKLAGEQAVASANSRHAIVRVTWVYSPFASNFIKLMLNLARTEAEISVIDDQTACPTPALDLAQGLFTMAEKLTGNPQPAFHGVFHGAGAEPVDRFTFAETALTLAARRGHPMPALRRVKTADFFAAAPRPSYSALNSHKLETVYGIKLPGWRDALERVVSAVLTPVASETEGR